MHTAWNNLMILQWLLWSFWLAKPKRKQN